MARPSPMEPNTSYGISSAGQIQVPNRPQQVPLDGQLFVDAVVLQFCFYNVQVSSFHLLSPTMVRSFVYNALVLQRIVVYSTYVRHNPTVLIYCSLSFFAYLQFKPNLPELGRRIEPTQPSVYPCRRQLLSLTVFLITVPRVPVFHYLTDNTL
jgi:hypothetical protein